MSGQLTKPSSTTTSPKFESNHTTTFEYDIMYLHGSLNVGVGLVIMILGIIGNAFSFVVLSYDKRSKAACFLLKSLSVVDSIVLISGALRDYENYYSQFNMYPGTSLLAEISFLISGYLSAVFRGVSIWLTVLIAGIRYLAIQFPLYVKANITLSKVRYMVAVLLLLSVILFMPVMYIYFMRLCRALGRCQMNETLDISNFTPGDYKAIANLEFAGEVMVTVIPLFLLIILSALLLSAYHRAVQVAGQITSHNSQPERQITLSVIMVVVVLIICQVPSLVFVLKSTINHSYSYGDVWQHILIIAQFSHSLNSAVNFIIYSMCSKHFRTNLANLISTRLGR